MKNRGQSLPALAEITMHVDGDRWVILPAAGSGSRMRATTPKQYIRIGKKTIIEHTVSCFVDRADIKEVVVVTAADDNYWHTLSIAKHKKITHVPGGKERYQSVLNGLRTLVDKAGQNDWVLVHDAVRPCLQQADINNLINAVATHPVGGLLATPINDTIKRVNYHHQVTKTINRDQLWCALTPQMFRWQVLLAAINAAIKNDIHITDEAMAVEQQGYMPLVVEGGSNNIKITRESDLLLAEKYLKIGKKGHENRARVRYASSDF